MNSLTGTVSDPAGQAEEALLARLVTRMNESGGFPALDHSVARIVEALERGEEDTEPLINAVLDDVSLTQKVLRLANSAMYAPLGRNVSTVSHALMVLGFEAVGHLALGARLIGALGDMQPASPSAERELAHSLVAGSVAGSVVGHAGLRNGEIGVVCALLHRTGRLLAAFHLPEEWARIQAAMAAGQPESEAARAALGMGLDELGMRIARQWRLPGKIVGTMRAEATEAGAPDLGDDEAWLLALTRFSDSAADCLAGGDASLGEQSLLAERFGPALGLAPDALLDAVQAATDAVTAEPLLAGILAEPRETPGETREADDPHSRLEAGVRDVGRAIAERGVPADIQRMVVEVAFRALNLSQAAILARDPVDGRFRVTASLAARTPNRLAGFVLPVRPEDDLAHLALARRLDIYIDNPRDTKIAPRLPDWVRAQGAHPFFLLPVADAAGQPLGLFYGQQADDAKLGKDILGRLAELRDLVAERMAA